MQYTYINIWFNFFYTLLMVLIGFLIGLAVYDGNETIKNKEANIESDTTYTNQPNG